MKKIIAGALTLLTIGTTTAFACGGHHGGCHSSYNGYRAYNNYYSHSCYTDVNHDGICDNCHYYSSGHRGGYWCYR